MAWTTSAIFQQATLNPLLGKATGSTNPTTFTSWVSDTIDCALFGTTPTPDKTVAVTSTGYNTGVWTTGNESSGTGYTAGGTALASKANTIDSGSSSLCFTAANPSWTGATLSGVFGDLIYDASITSGTVAKQGFCFNYFGGSQGVTAGTFTIQWATPPSGAVTAVFNFAV